MYMYIYTLSDIILAVYECIVCAAWYLHLLFILNIRVTRVDSKMLVMKDKKTRKEVSVPYGICVWSTGIAPTPIAKTIMERIPYQSKGWVGGNTSKETTAAEFTYMYIYI